MDASFPYLIIILLNCDVYKQAIDNTWKTKPIEDYASTIAIIRNLLTIIETHTQEEELPGCRI